MRLFQEVIPVLDVPEGVSSAGQLADFQGNKIDVGLHGSRNLRSITAVVYQLKDLILRKTNLGSKRVGFKLHHVIIHVKQAEFLKDRGLLSVKLIMTDLMPQHDVPHDRVQVTFDEDKAIAFNDFVDAFLLFKRNFHDGDIKFPRNAFRISGSDISNDGVSTGNNGISIVQTDQ
jgi:hypothetical protein